MMMTLGETLLFAVALKKARMAYALDRVVNPRLELSAEGYRRQIEEAHREDLDAKPRFKLEPEPPPATALQFGLPVQGRISSPFGQRMHPTLHRRRLHAGVDIAAAHGTPILAPAAGRVISAGWRGGYGLAVLVDHGNGYTTLYGHMSAIAVGVGDQVDAGATLGQVGRTGTATGDHVHFETRRNGVPVDPAGVQ